MPPSHRNRSANEIISTDVYHDAVGFAYRAASWVDLVRRTKDFAALHYACVDARLAIENLVFEQLVITAGNTLTYEIYQSCLRDSGQLSKRLRKLVPDYEKLQAFTVLVGTLSPGIPKLNQWDIKELMKSWGILSTYLHWSGANSETTENRGWQEQAIETASKIIDPLWQKMSSGHSACLRPEDMKPRVREVWEDFRTGTIDLNSARTRLEIVRPL
jgi:hypothetical protein